MSIEQHKQLLRRCTEVTIYQEKVCIKNEDHFRKIVHLKIYMVATKYRKRKENVDVFQLKYPHYHLLGGPSYDRLLSVSNSILISVVYFIIVTVAYLFSPFFRLTRYD